MRRLRIPVTETVIVFRRFVDDARRQFRAHRPVENEDVGVFLEQHSGGFLNGQTDFRPAFDGDEFGLVLDDQFAKRLHGQRRVALVVHDDILDRPSQDAAGGVDFLHRHFLDVHARTGARRSDHADVADDKRLSLRLRHRNGWYADSNRNQQ